MASRLDCASCSAFRGRARVGRGRRVEAEGLRRLPPFPPPHSTPSYEAEDIPIHTLTAINKSARATARSLGLNPGDLLVLPHSLNSVAVVMSTAQPTTAQAQPAAEPSSKQSEFQVVREDE